MNSTKKDQIIVSLQVEGLHNWPDCPIEEVDYLKDMHRHMFHIKCWKCVYHHDRQVEIIQLKHSIDDYLLSEYYNDTCRCLLFEALSCEMIATELNNQFALYKCEVLEDGENGALIYA